jgi:arylsulfatase A-like enzyme
MGVFRKLIGAIGLAAVVLAGTLALSGCGRTEARVTPQPEGVRRPNIVVFVAEDFGLQVGAYGDLGVRTPALDQLAREGMIFTQAFAASGSHQGAYAALLTGMHPQTLGVVREWTGAPSWSVVPPPEVRGFPELLRASGYTTVLMGSDADSFGASAALWDVVVRDPKQRLPVGELRSPFLLVIRIAAEAPAREGRRTGDDASQASAAQPAVPPYLPDIPEVRRDVEAQQGRAAEIDARVAEILAWVERAGVKESTSVVFTSDHGPRWPRAANTVYDAGVRVPLIVRRAGAPPAGSVRRDLVSGVDIAPSILGLTGLEPLAWMHGRNRFEHSTDPGARYAFSIQTSVDRAPERTLAVRDGRWLYVRNDAPETALADLASPGPALDALRVLYRSGRAGGALATFFQTPRPDEELYDLGRDAGQLNNLAADPAAAADLQRLSSALDAFMLSAPDLSTLDDQALQDRFAPGGVQAVTARPTGRFVRDRLVLESMTPGAAVLWRKSRSEPWRLYRDAAPVKEGDWIEAKAVRYGFKESGVERIQAR